MFLLVFLLTVRLLDDPGRVYGTLQSSPSRLPQITAAGVDLVTLSVRWNRFEPVEGQIDSGYLSQVRNEVAQYRAAGMEIVLGTGVHHPPAWVLNHPDSRYVNQYGDPYASAETGKGIANMIFNQTMRDKQDAYLGRLFGALGTDFYGVRLGGGWYGELNYPEPTYNGRTNSYWGFDAIALGDTGGLPEHVRPNPVPNWRPGMPSRTNEPARFANWYMESLRNYHDWQITTVRQWYGGRLLMLYPSWGIRPGQLDAAVAANLAGTTTAERNGEIQRGFDFARYIAGITDPDVVVYTTWLNADASADNRADQRYWSPVKYLAHLAQSRPQPLDVMGENTGRDTAQDMSLSFHQLRQHQLIGLVWAFEPELFDDTHATINDYAHEIATDRTR
jgi:hypothetical protein